MRQSIYFVSHCILNTASKTGHEMTQDYIDEEKNRLAFLERVKEEQGQMIQLPCPELLMYGAARWGHSRSQFDNAFYKKRCEELAQIYILQMEEYLKYPNKFLIKAVVGINGSPSCGIDFSFDGAGWGGEFSHREDMEKVLKSGFASGKMGVFMEILKQEMAKAGIDIPFIAL